MGESSRRGVLSLPFLSEPKFFEGLSIRCLLPKQPALERLSFSSRSLWWTFRVLLLTEVSGRAAVHRPSPKRWTDENATCLPKQAGSSSVVRCQPRSEVD